MSLTLGVNVDLYIYMFMLVSMTLSLMQGHNGSAMQKSCVEHFSTSKQAISITLTATVGPFLRDLDFANVYLARPSGSCISYSGVLMHIFQMYAASKDKSLQNYDHIKNKPETQIEPTHG